MARRKRPQVRRAGKPRRRSFFEDDFASNLSRRRIPFDYESIRLGYTLDCEYLLDFVVHRPDSTVFYVETKGRLTSADRRKMIAVKKAHPDIDLRLVFMNPRNRLDKRSKTTYAQWAERHGFPWAERTVPKEWLKPIS